MVEERRCLSEVVRPITFDKHQGRASLGQLLPDQIIPRGHVWNASEWPTDDDPWHGEAVPEGSFIVPRKVLDVKKDTFKGSQCVERVALRWCPDRKGNTVPLVFNGKQLSIERPGNYFHSQSASLRDDCVTHQEVLRATHHPNAEALREARWFDPKEVVGHALDPRVLFDPNPMVRSDQLWTLVKQIEQGPALAIERAILTEERQRTYLRGRTFTVDAQLTTAVEAEAHISIPPNDLFFTDTSTVYKLSSLRKFVIETRQSRRRKLDHLSKPRCLHLVTWVRSFSFSGGDKVRFCSGCTKYDDERRELLKTNPMAGPSGDGEWNAELAKEGLAVNQGFSPDESFHGTSDDLARMEAAIVQTRCGKRVNTAHPDPNDHRHRTAKSHSSRDHHADERWKKEEHLLPTPGQCLLCGNEFYDRAGMLHCSDNHRKRWFEIQQADWEIVRRNTLVLAKLIQRPRWSLSNSIIIANTWCKRLLVEEIAAWL